MLEIMSLRAYQSPQFRKPQEGQDPPKGKYPSSLKQELELR